MIGARMRTQSKKETLHCPEKGDADCRSQNLGLYLTGSTTEGFFFFFLSFAFNIVKQLVLFQ